jgi:hypothetical protein
LKLTAILPETEEHLPETRLWKAVIISTILEWMHGPLRYKAEAEEYLFGDRSDFAIVCERAGMNAGRIRLQLSRLVRQGVVARVAA